MRRALIVAAVLASPAQADRVTVIRPLAPAAKAVALAQVTVGIGGTAAAGIADPAETERYRALIADAVRAALAGGAGEPIDAAITIDTLVVAGTGAAFLNAPDRIAGLVELFAAGTRQPLGMLYIDVENRHPGIVGAALRGAAVRETLAKEFAVKLGKALRGPKR